MCTDASYLAKLLYLARLIMGLGYNDENTLASYWDQLLPTLFSLIFHEHHVNFACMSCFEKHLEFLNFFNLLHSTNVQLLALVYVRRSASVLSTSFFFLLLFLFRLPVP